MSILHLRARPAIAFDVNNPKHREYYNTFVRTGTWGAAPVRFLVESLNTDLVSYINQKMLSYYLDQEFKHVKKTAVKKSTAKSPLRSVSRKHSVQA
jgi:hypothetical protein